MTVTDGMYGNATYVGRLAGLQIVESDLLFDYTEDWSKVRSPARARRRRARGFPQNIKIVAVPQTKVYCMGDKLVMHPAIADRIRRELLTYPRGRSALDPTFGTPLPDWLAKRPSSIINTDPVIL